MTKDVEAIPGCWSAFCTFTLRSQTSARKHPKGYKISIIPPSLECYNQDMGICKWLTLYINIYSLHIHILISALYNFSDMNHSHQPWPYAQPPWFTESIQAPRWKNKIKNKPNTMYFPATLLHTHILYEHGKSLANIGNTACFLSW